MLPGSKSITNRALIVASLADGDTVLRHALLADDTRLMIDALRRLGIAITVDEADGAIEVSGCRGHLPAEEAELSCGNAGTVMRFCAALVSLGQGRFTLDGAARMRDRPIGGLMEALGAMGAGVSYDGRRGYPPMTIRANGLQGGSVAFCRPLSSQWVSALMMVAPYAHRDVLIDVVGPVPSVPYLRMTTAVMDRFGVGAMEQFDDDGGAKIIVPAPQRYQGCLFNIEPDASNASYFLAAPAVAGGRVTVEGVGTASLQGDARFVDVLERMGCRITREPHRLTVSGPNADEPLCGVEVNLGAMPDMVQTLAVVALFAVGPTVMCDVATLRLKETDRLAALERELTKLGATVTITQDKLIVDPPATPRPATIDTYADHRMAMSFAICGLRVPGVILRGWQCCTKTFPGFFDIFERLVEKGR